MNLAMALTPLAMIFVLEGFGLRRYIGNAVLTTGAERIVYRDLIVEGTDDR